LLVLLYDWKYVFRIACARAREAKANSLALGTGRRYRRARA